MSWHESGLWGLLGCVLYLVADEGHRLAQMRHAMPDVGLAGAWNHMLAEYGNPFFVLGTLARLGVAFGVVAVCGVALITCAEWTSVALGMASPAFALDKLLATLWPPMRGKS